MIAQAAEVKADVPLVVDLNGTLIKSDLLLEVIMQYLKKNPLYIIFIIKWGFGGVVNLKNKIAANISINASLLPYNQEFVNYLKNENENGCILILATASHISYAKGRDYHFSDIETLRAMGISSGLLSVIVCALYINSSDVLLLYNEPRVLWLICPLLLYWINRLWLKTGREEMHDDPVVFAVKDHESKVIFFIIGLLLFIATYL